MKGVEVTVLVRDFSDDDIYDIVADFQESLYPVMSNKRYDSFSLKFVKICPFDRNVWHHKKENLKIRKNGLYVCSKDS